MTDEHQSEKASKKTEKRLRWIILVVAIVIVVVRVVFPTVFERVDAVAIGLLVVALIPWISTYVSKISIPGVLEAELRELKRQVEEAKQDSVSASEMALRSQDLSFSASAAAKPRGMKSGTPDKLLAQGKEYVNLRRSMPSGSQRTAAMDSLFRKMVTEARSLGSSWLDHSAWLRSDDPSKQLSAVAYAYSMPGSVEVAALLDAIETSKQPFVQYWSLRGIRLALDEGARVSPNDSRRLRELERAIRSGTDRHMILTAINRMLETS